MLTLQVSLAKKAVLVWESFVFVASINRGFCCHSVNVYTIIFHIVKFCCSVVPSKCFELLVQSVAAQVHHLHISRTTQYIWYPSTF